MDEEETVQRDLSETPLEAPQPKKRGRPKKEREMEQVDVTISSKGKEKTFTASRPKRTPKEQPQQEPPQQEQPTQRGQYYNFHHQNPSNRHNAFRAIMSAW